MYVFDPTWWWNRASQHLIRQETNKKRTMLYLIKSRCKASMIIEVGFFLLNLRLLYFSLRMWIIGRASYIRGRSPYRRSWKLSGILGEIRDTPSGIITGVANLVAGMRRLSTSPLPVGDTSSMGGMTWRSGSDILCWRWGVGVACCQPGKSRLGCCRYGATPVRPYLLTEPESIESLEWYERSDPRCCDERDALLTVVTRFWEDRCELARLCVERVDLIFPGKGYAENATPSKEIISPCSMRV